MNHIIHFNGGFKRFVYFFMPFTMIDESSIKTTTDFTDYADRKVKSGGVI